MFGRKFSSNIRRRKRMIISSIILLVVFLGLGYAAFTTNLGINGTLKVDKYDHLLYGVLEKEAKEGTYAKEYTGNHQDSIAGVGTEKIYHWYAPTGTAGNTLANEILDKNNVIFANHCWQMIRTTDTGGVKMIYNGKTVNNKCLTDRNNDIGYSNYTSLDLSTNYYYGTRYLFNPQTQTFSLSGEISTGAIKEKEYTCLGSTSTETCETLYLVAKQANGVYYGIAIDNNSIYSQFGKVLFNDSRDYLSDIGYMHNEKYTTSNRTVNIYTSTVLQSQSGYNNKYYADDIVWNTTTNKYELVNPFLLTSYDNTSSIIGKYTFNSADENYTNSTVRYVVEARMYSNQRTCFYINLSSGNDYNYYVNSYTYGDDIIVNNDGTFTIDNPQTFNTLNYLDFYNNLLDKYICYNVSNATCANPMKITSASATSFRYINNIYKFSNSFTYNNNQYTLEETTSDIFAGSGGLNTRHYTCYNMTGVCDKIYYIIFYKISCNTNKDCYYHMQLSDGKNINDVYNSMIQNNNININDSIIKIALEAWYKMELDTYTNYIEDTIYCNNRDATNRELGGWNPNGGDIQYNELGFLYSDDLVCPRLIDSFSTSNNRAKTNYPVGLLNYKELSLLNSSLLRKTSDKYWMMTPRNYSWHGGTNLTAEVNMVNENGEMPLSIVSYPTASWGLRPVISLKPGTEYVSGTGSMEDPFVVQ